ncbi:hypothetical protein NL676_034365 [Syzygium grande]|nr:hypothetical protein NL676_034365 [Syzygium grande]
MPATRSAPPVPAPRIDRSINACYTKRPARPCPASHGPGAVAGRNFTSWDGDGECNPGPRPTPVPVPVPVPMHVYRHCI